MGKKQSGGGKSICCMNQMRKIELPSQQGREVLLKDTASQLGFLKKWKNINKKYNDHGILQPEGIT